MSKILAVLYFTFVSFNCFSQRKNETSSTDVTKISFFTPGLSFEKSLGKSKTIYLEAFMNLSVWIEHSSQFENASTLYIDPAFAIQKRYYYNLLKREAKQKRVDMNSANYLAPLAQVAFSKKSISGSPYFQKTIPVFTLGFVWGMQRNYKSRFSLDFDIGIGYIFGKGISAYNSTTKYAGQFTIPGQLNLGFWLNRRKKV